MIRIVVADDQPLIRSALRALLEDIADFTVVAEAGDGDAAVRAVAQHRPDVALMDIRMPSLDGLAATRRIRDEMPGTVVIVLTTYDLDEYVFEAVRAGAAGFLLKDGDADELERAIRAVVGGEALMAPSALRRLMEEFTRAPRPDPGASRRVAQLTQREREVLEQMATGRSNDEIAAVLHLSVATVKTHVGSVLTKLGVRDRTQAVVVGHDAGIRPGRSDNLRS
jgi:DNA-binding NarL/FixJ family response regulator